MASQVMGRFPAAVPQTSAGYVVVPASRAYIRTAPVTVAVPAAASSVRYGTTATTAGAALGALAAAGPLLGRPRQMRVGTAGRNASVVATAASGTPTLHLGIVGYGLVGKELVKQVLASAKGLEAELGVKLEIAGVARSKTMVLLPPGSNDTLTDGAWPSGEEDVDLQKLGDHVVAAAAASGGKAMVVDNTASDAPAEMYEKWLAAGASVATPNKKAGSGPYSRYERIMAAQKTGGSTFLYEATVGAGLPVLGPLQTLNRAGDKVETVEGIFSGTLSYIFNTWKPGMKFSDVVKEAKDNGFTEPDPRDDLSGTDVQRKVTILARECGLKLELDDVPVKSLVPEALQDWSPPEGQNLGDAFVEGLLPYDDEMDKMIQEAEAANEVIRFVGSIDLKAGTAAVKLARYPKDHPFAGTQFADNIVAFNTQWYTPRPLVVQGPGAGAAVTAAGVFGNVMDVMTTLKGK